LKKNKLFKNLKKTLNQIDDKRNINSLNLNNIIIDNNLANLLINVLKEIIRKMKTISYLTFSKKGDKDINDFITEIEKVFTIN